MAYDKNWEKKYLAKKRESDTANLKSPLVSKSNNKPFISPATLAINQNSTSSTSYINIEYKSDNDDDDDEIVKIYEELRMTKKTKSPRVLKQNYKELKTVYDSNETYKSSTLESPKYILAHTSTNDVENEYVGVTSLESPKHILAPASSLSSSPKHTTHSNITCSILEPVPMKKNKFNYILFSSWYNEGLTNKYIEIILNKCDPNIKTDPIKFALWYNNGNKEGYVDIIKESLNN